MKATWIRTFVPGILLGFTVSRLGFTDYRELHRMLVFRDLRLLLAFAFAVGLAIVLFAAIRGRLKIAPVRFHRGLVPGSVAFGVGWALTGACPGVVLAQLGQGTAPALLSLAGVLLGSRAGLATASEGGGGPGRPDAEAIGLAEAGLVPVERADRRGEATRSQVSGCAPATDARPSKDR